MALRAARGSFRPAQRPRRGIPTSAGTTEGAGSREAGLVAASDPFGVEKGATGPRLRRTPTRVVPSPSGAIVGTQTRVRKRREGVDNIEGLLIHRSMAVEQPCVPRREAWLVGRARRGGYGYGTFTYKHQGQLEVRVLPPIYLPGKCGTGVSSCREPDDTHTRTRCLAVPYQASQLQPVPIDEGWITPSGALRLRKVSRISLGPQTGDLLHGCWVE